MQNSLFYDLQFNASECSIVLPDNMINWKIYPFLHKNIEEFSCLPLFAKISWRATLTSNGAGVKIPPRTGKRAEKPLKLRAKCQNLTLGTLLIWISKDWGQNMQNPFRSCIPHVERPIWAIHPTTWTDPLSTSIFWLNLSPWFILRLEYYKEKLEGWKRALTILPSPTFSI